LIDIGKIANKSVKYTAEDLEQMIGEFFERSPWSEQFKILIPSDNECK
jgi:hypothetical protein